MLFCGLDIGTTNVKAVLIDDQGKLLAKTFLDATPSAGTKKPNSGNWNALCESSLDRLLEQITPTTADIYCSVTTQGGSFLILNHDFRPISPQFLWVDRADPPMAHKLTHTLGKQNFYQLTGWPSNDWLAIAKLSQMAIKPSDHIAFVPDYICSQLTGKLVTDITNAQITGLLDFQNGAWHSKLLNWANIQNRNLSPVIDKIQVLYENIKTRWGKLNWVTSSHDQYAAMRAVDIQPHQNVMLATGTAWVINHKTQNPVFDQHCHNHPGRDFQPGVFGNIQALGSIGRGYDNLLTKLHLTHSDLNTTQAVQALQNVPAPREDINFDLENITPTQTEPLVSLKRYMEWAGSIVRFHLELGGQMDQGSRIIMTGGAAANKLWPQIIANVCGITVEAAIFDELTAYGAACFSAQATGVQLPNALDKLAPPRIFTPTDNDSYNEWYQKHQKPTLTKCLQ